MSIDNEQDLAALRRIGRLVALVLQQMGRAARPGISTRELDELGRSLLERDGARPAPELAYGFPGATCISVDDEAAHGIPGRRRTAGPRRPPTAA